MGYTTEGCNHVNDVVLRSATQVPTWYVGLILDPPSLSAADTLASHAGWTEVTTYAETARPTLVPGASSAGQSDAAPVTFTMTVAKDVAGYFIASNSTKGGTTGKLLRTCLFTEGVRAMLSGQILVITPSQLAQDATN
jgi:hypothetical protein